jgi:hypothetical protein
VSSASETRMRTAATTRRAITLLVREEELGGPGNELTRGSRAVR